LIVHRNPARDRLKTQNLLDTIFARQRSTMHNIVLNQDNS